MPSDNAPRTPTLARHMGLLGLIATGVCSMVGGAINVIPVMVQRNVPGIGPWVPLAYALAVVPAALAAFAYAILASGMPRAGGSYVYASRSIHPYVGFIASFSQWFGLAAAMGVVAYILVPFLRDIAIAVGAVQGAALLDTGVVRVALALLFVWGATILNLLGVKTYERAVITLMFLGLISGLILIPAGFAHDHVDYAGVIASAGEPLPPAPAAPLNLVLVFAATPVLFSSFIGFDSIAQAGGEAKNPGRALPLAIGICLVGVTVFYMLFTGAVYHSVPWWYVAGRAQSTDLTAPGLLAPLLPSTLAVLVVAGAAVSLFNSLPGMLLGISRLMFAWGEDRIFLPVVARIHSRWRTPHVAILISSATASVAVFGCELAGDFFLGVDLLVIGMLVNFIVMCLSVIALPYRNPELAREIRFVKTRSAQLVLAGLGGVTLTLLLVAQIAKDLTSEPPHWYLHSTWSYLVVVALGSLIFGYRWRLLRNEAADPMERFRSLPPS